MKEGVGGWEKTRSGTLLLAVNVNSCSNSNYDEVEVRAFL